MDLTQQENNKYKLVIPCFKWVKPNFNQIGECIPYYEYFYFDTYDEAIKHLNLLKNKDKCFILGCKNG